MEGEYSNTFDRSQIQVEQSNTVPYQFQYISLKDAVEIVHKFDGKNIPIKHFVESCRLAGNLLPTAAHPALINLIKTRLDGDVKSLVIATQFNSLEEFLRLIQNTFGQKRSSEHYISSLTSVFQNSDETVIAYSNRIRSLLSDIEEALDLESSSPTTEILILNARKTALKCFFRGLKPSIESRLARGNISTLDDAISQAITAEQEFLEKRELMQNGPRQQRDRQQRDRPPRNQENNVSCSYCERKGHATDECRIKKRDVENGKTRTRCSYCKFIGHTENECRKKRNERQNSTTAATVTHTRCKDTPNLCIKLGRAPLIKTFSNEFQERRSTLMVDTGAEVNIIKINKLYQTSGINTNDTLTLNGITDGEINVLGSIILHIFGKTTLFYVVPETFPIPYDGILGNAFFVQTKAIICYDRNKIIIGNKRFPFIVEDVIEIPARTQIQIPIKITNHNLREGILPPKELLGGVYLMGSIVRRTDNNVAYTMAVNTNENSVNIKIPEEQIEEYIIMDPVSEDTQNEETNERCKQIEDLINMKHLNEEEKQAVKQIIKENADRFHLPNENLPPTNVIQHRIITLDKKPINIKQYRHPPLHREEIKKQTSELLQKGIIEPSSSPYNSPLWVVPKKPTSDGTRKWRVVVDFRQLNDKTLGDAYPLPNITDILDQLGSAKYFSTFDLATGFHQVPMADEDKEKTAFTTPHGHYHFTRMPFGVKNGPATFQRMMDLVLTGLQGLELFVYLDDIVVYASSLQEHYAKVSRLMKRLRDANLSLQPEKCNLLQKEVIYLGHIISEKGVQPNPEKVKAITNFPTPNTLKKSREFLGLAGYYRRFIKGFSKIAKPISDLQKKGTPFKWGQEQENAFNILKQALTTEPILQFPRYDEPFIITTDASNVAIGAVLSQITNGHDLPIAYASRVLNKAETNYDTTEKELLAIIYAVKYFRPYIYGKHFTLITDHEPLTWLNSVKDPSSRLMRWRLKLAEYSYDIKYKPGLINRNADALSRNPPICMIQGNESRDKQSKRQHIQTSSGNPAPKKKVRQDDVTGNSLEDQGNEERMSIEPEIASSPSMLSLSSSSSSELFSFPRWKQMPSAKQRKRKQSSVCSPNPKHMKRSFSKENISDTSHKEQELTETSPVLGRKYKRRSSIPRYTTHQSPVAGPSKDHYSHVPAAILESSTEEELDMDPRPVPASEREQVKIHERIVPLLQDRQGIIEETHRLLGHKGITKTFEKIRENYTWKNMRQHITDFINKCKDCQKKKLVRIKNRQEMIITDTPLKPMDKVALDIMGPLPTTERGNNYILTMQDQLSKYSIAAPLKDNSSAQVADSIIRNLICRFGCPKTILTDQGSNFTSDVMRRIAKSFGIPQVVTSIYHPQSNGSLERSHIVLTEFLKQRIRNRKDWDQWIEHATFAYNSTVHESTRYSPHEIMFGQKLRTPSAFLKEPPPVTYTEYVENISEHLSNLAKQARQNLIASKERNKKYYDKRARPVHYMENEWVYLKNNKKQTKLDDEYLGPFKILKVLPNNNIKIQTGNRTKIVHYDLVKPARGYSSEY